MQFEQLGPYRIEHILGRGGMGAVYAAVHSETGEPCAIKVLSGAIADDDHFRDRFKGEVETLQTLRHPNIVGLLGYGEQDGRLFFAMEMVEGSSLQEALSKKKFSWREVVDLTVQICGALKHAHDHGVIHRDLKPANLLLTNDGKIKLTDFGIAKLFGATQITAAGGIIGTADYMAPEQAEGLPITNRTDLYSLGCVMYAMLSRRPPFSGKTVPEIMHCLKYVDPEPVGRVAIGTPQELEDIISQLLSKDPAKRISNARLISKRLKSMEFGLLKQQEKDDFVLSDDDPPPSKADAPPTEMPTAARPTLDLPTSEFGSGELTQAAGRAAKPVDGEETIVTEGKSEEKAGLETQRPRAPETHFVTVEQSASGSGGRRSGQANQESLKPSTILSTLGIGAALLLVVGGIWYGSQPLSADDLYQQIAGVAETSESADLIDVKPSMEEFVRRFPDDPRHEKVQFWLDDYSAHRLWRRLEREARKVGGIEFLSDIQGDYVKACRSLKLDPGKSRSVFLGLADSEVDADDEADDRACQAAALHFGKRLQTDL